MGYGPLSTQQYTKTFSGVEGLGLIGLMFGFIISLIGMYGRFYFGITFISFVLEMVYFLGFSSLCCVLGFYFETREY